MKKTMLTQPGAEKLHEELKWLQQIERSRAIEAIRVARDSPDFLESA
jgi:transcription elongation GreA/GreB family factor